jgi:hypothetical protein
MIVQMWDGMGMQVTEPMIRLFPWCSYEDFPTNYCGPGDGLEQRLIPDSIFGLTAFLPGFLDISIKLAPACFIHDLDWQFAPPTWDAFHESNSRFYANLKTIVEAKAKPGLIRRHAKKFPAIYAQTVDTLGRPKFWALKRDQGLAIPASAAWLIK